MKNKRLKERGIRIIGSYRTVSRYGGSYILSSLHRLLVFFHASRSSMPCSIFIPIPNPRSTHCLLPISTRRESARANANSSSSLDLSSSMDMPIMLRKASTGRSAVSSAVSPFASVALGEFEEDHDLVISLISASERKS